ncbi:MAG: hypothetical protein ACLSHO_02875 [Dysosmobacter sp.]
MDNAARYVSRPAARWCTSTCTILPEENEQCNRQLPDGAHATSAGTPFTLSGTGRETRGAS